MSHSDVDCLAFSECCSSWCVDCSGYQRSSPAHTEAVWNTRDTWWRPVAGVLSSVDRHPPTTSGSFAWLSGFVSCMQCKFYFSFIFGPQSWCYYFCVCLNFVLFCEIPTSTGDRQPKVL